MGSRLAALLLAITLTASSHGVGDPAVLSHSGRPGGGGAARAPAREHSHGTVSIARHGPSADRVSGYRVCPFRAERRAAASLPHASPTVRRARQFFFLANPEARF